MTLPDSIYTYLSERSAITAIVGDSIYHMDTLDQSPDPALFFEEVAEDRVQPFRATPEGVSTRVSFECWSSSQATAEALDAALYAAFMNPAGDFLKFSGTLGTGGVTVLSVHHEGSRPLYQNDPRQFGRELDITFFYIPA